MKITLEDVMPDVKEKVGERLYNQLMLCLEDFQQEIEKEAYELGHKHGYEEALAELE